MFGVVRSLFSSEAPEDPDNRLVQGIATSRLFDDRWYARQVGGLARDRAAEHYFRTGWREGRDPSPYFSTTWYLTTYPDVRAADLCPLTHFLMHGAQEGRSTSPFFQAQRMARSMGLSDDADHPLLVYLSDWQRKPWPAITLFDAAFFLAGLPGEAESSVREPFARFMADGARLGVDPHPLFSVSFYLDQNRDVLASGINPLQHFVMEGGANLLDPHPCFDSRFYAEQVASSSGGEIGIPLIHYLTIGAMRGLDPSEGFSTTDYLALNPDLRGSPINPLVHYVLYGVQEARPVRPSRRRILVLAGPASPATGPRQHEARVTETSAAEIGTTEIWRPLSVVIPTYNRLDILKDTLETCERHRGGVPLEYVIVDDGSTDETYAFISKLSFPESTVRAVRTSNNGPGPARNEGAKVASHEILLFMGDDIRPENDDFFRAHSRFHQRRPAIGEAMLGKVVWPSSHLLPNNFVMSHIQGREGEQFCFADMVPYRCYEFSAFYTANVSVKRSVVDWSKDGFCADFKLYGFEDTEFAYRLRKMGRNLSIHYDPMSSGVHFHPYGFEQFVKRQLNVGRMASTFVQKHPETVDILKLSEVTRALKSHDGPASHSAKETLAIFEGIRAWIGLQESRGYLGTRGYHKELLAAFFHFAFLNGYIHAAASPTDHLDEALSMVLDRFFQRIRRLISCEIADGLEFFYE